MEGKRDASQASVVEVVASEMKLPLDELALDRSLQDLGVSSFGIIQVILALEEEFGIEFSDQDLKGLTTVTLSGLYDIVQQAAQPS